MEIKELHKAVLTAICQEISEFDLFTEDDQTIKDLEDVDTIGQIIACAMKHKII